MRDEAKFAETSLMRKATDVMTSPGRVKELEKRLRHQAFHDQLTGLPNRTLFGDRVAHALATAQRANAAIAVLFVDLDDFKLINDSLGHAAGDDLLRTVAQRLQGRLRASDTAARLGGDEFAILVEGVASTDDVRQLAEDILEVLAEPYTASDSQMMAPRASIGIAISDGPTSDRDGLLQDADVAMHAAKRQGKGSFAFFEESMRLAAVRRFELTNELEKALAAEQFELYYQPIVILETEEISGVEALIRWNHPRHGTLAPGEFIPIAEETGLIVPIGRWVLNEACRKAGSWQTHRRGEPSPYVCVNISTRQLQEPQLISDVRAALDAGGLRPDQLVIEITESQLIQKIEQTRDRLKELKRLGVRLAVDDFGTGYSALSYLRRFPFDILKIDKSFVDGLRRGSDQSSIVRAIVELGSSLGLDMIAEGIEQPEQVAELRAMDAHFGQGYYFARPVNASAITTMLTTSVPSYPPHPAPSAMPSANCPRQGGGRKLLDDGFIGVASHELRTPLTTTKGYIELLLDGGAGEVTEEQRRFLETARRSTGRLERLIEDFLVARVQAGDAIVVSGRVCLNKLLSETVERARTRAEAKGIELTLEADPVGDCAGSPDLLALLLDKLISNALTYATDGGQVNVRLVEDSGSAVFEVQDDGCGIPATERERAFEPFYRGSVATQQVIDGIGLGLTISHAIVEAHGGRISLKNEQGADTTVRVELPLDMPAEATEKNLVAA